MEGSNVKPSATSPVVLAFAEVMEQKLRENSHKGEREGWLDMPCDGDPGSRCTPSRAGILLDLLLGEVKELREALRKFEVAGGDGDGVTRECADVANYAMMIADVVGGLRVPKP